MVTNYETAIFGSSSSQLWVGMMTERKWRHNLAWSIASAGLKETRRVHGGSKVYIIYVNRNVFIHRLGILNEEGDDDVYGLSWLSI